MLGLCCLPFTDKNLATQSEERVLLGNREGERERNREGDREKQRGREKEKERETEIEREST